VVIDIVVGVLVLLFAALSYRRGLLRRLAGIAALVIASLTAGFVGREAAAYAAQRWGYSSAVLYAVCCVVAWVVLFLVSRLILRRIAKGLGSDEEGDVKPWNKKLGALFGILEAAALCWLVVGILDAVPEDIRAERFTGLHNQLEGSFFTNWVVRPTNPATRLELQPMIDDLAVVADEPQALRGIERHEKLQALFRNEKLQAVLADEKLLTEWQKGRYARFFADRKVREALEDPELRDLIRELPVQEILHEAAERARKAEP
jgi:uncharacterized membrane protein required for colicin V production